MADAKDTYMQYQISGIHIDVGDALQTHVKGELNGAISKYAERPTDAQIVFSKSGHEFVCDAIIHLSTGLTAQAKASKEKSMQLLTRALKKLKSNYVDIKENLKRITNIEINQLNLLIPHRIPARQKKVKKIRIHI